MTIQSGNCFPERTELRVIAMKGSRNCLLYSTFPTQGSDGPFPGCLQLLADQSQATQHIWAPVLLPATMPRASCHLHRSSGMQTHRSCTSLQHFTTIMPVPEPSTAGSSSACVPLTNRSGLVCRGTALLPGAVHAG